MNISHAMLGFVSGIVIFYLLSLSSAHFAMPAESVPPTSALLSIFAFTLSGILITRFRIALAAAITICLMTSVSLLIGSAHDHFILPSPDDLMSLFLHGGQTPMVPGAAAVLLVSSLLLLRAERVARLPHESEDENASEGAA